VLDGQWCREGRIEMNKREAKKRVYWAAYRILDNHGHANDFLYEEENEQDGERLLAAWEYLMVLGTVR